MQQNAASALEAASIDMRQLRHQTKNALTRILAQVSSELSATAASRRLALAVERRVLLTADISDALFGLTRAPGRFSERLPALCENVVSLMSEDGQCLQLECEVEVELPRPQQDPVLRVAHEFVSNAVKHGMHVRLVGRIRVRVARDGASTVLTVSDDGWGCGTAPRAGEGMHVAEALAQAVDGVVTLTRENEWTVARLLVPHPAA